MKTQDLDLDDDPAFQARMRPAQLAGWLLLVAFVLAAMLGLFGKSSLTVEKVIQGPLTLEYSRFLRQQTPDQLRVEVLVPVAARGKPVSIWVGNDFLNHADIQFVNPQPSGVEADGEESRYEFKVSEKTEKLSVTIQFAPQASGELKGHVRSEAEKISFHQLAYF